MNKAVSEWCWIDMSGYTRDCRFVNPLIYYYSSVIIVNCVKNFKVQNFETIKCFNNSMFLFDNIICHPLCRMMIRMTREVALWNSVIIDINENITMSNINVVLFPTMIIIGNKTRKTENI